MATRHYGDFEWDEAKARANRLKHDVSFEETLTAVADLLAIDAPDRYIPGRFVLIGHSARGRVLFVVYRGATGQHSGDQCQKSLTDPKEKI